MIDSVVVHAILQTEATLWAVDNASARPTSSKTLTLTLNNMLNSIFRASVFEVLPTPIKTKLNIIDYKYAIR